MCWLTCDIFTSYQKVSHVHIFHNADDTQFGFSFRKRHTTATMWFGGLYATGPLTISGKTAVERTEEDVVPV